MNKNEMARRKRQMNRRIRELVAIRRASLSLDSMPLDTPAPVSAVDITVVDIAVAPVRLTPFPQITPPRQLKPAVTVAAMATRTKSQAAPVCP